jgi:hypothetical protein
MDQHRLGNVMAQQLEHRVARQMQYIAATTGEKIVNRKHFVTGRNHLVTKVGSDKAGATGDHYFL